MPASEGRHAKKRNDPDQKDGDRLDPITAPELERRGSKRVVPALDPTFLYGGLGAALIGALVLSGAIYFNSTEVERQKTLVPAAGTVVDQQEQSYGTRSRVLLTVRFTTATGRTVDLQHVYDSKATRPAKGDAVSVLYDPADPARAELQDSGLLGYALVGAVGLAFLLVGLTLVVNAIRQWRQRAAAQAVRR
jgi:hypothetical protein